MALTAGSVTVDGNGNTSGSGLALALYNAKLAADPDAAWFAQYATADQSTVRQIRLVMKQRWAAESQGMATAIVAAITTDAVVSVAANAFGSGIPASPVNLGVD